jgi:SAM-dependent methyltransferase
MDKSTAVQIPPANRQNFSLWKHSLANPSLVMLVKEIRSVFRDCSTVLDIGCGNWSPVRFLQGARLTGLDGYSPALEEARRNGTHEQYALGDVTRISELFATSKFDACIALDVIEHLNKNDGWRMVEDMERLATKRVVIFTPNGFIPQKSRDGDLQEHLSGWTADEMRSRGYRVLGMYGPKSWRGEYHRIKYQPRPFWVILSMLAHYLYTRSRPEKAAAIFCVKNLER